MADDRGAKKRILDFLLSRVGRKVSLEEIRRTARISEWARRVRELKEAGWPIEHDVSEQTYTLTAANPTQPAKEGAAVSRTKRYEILARDFHRCRSCGRGPDDGAKLHVDHMLPRDWGGSNDDENLHTLCEECNLGKKNFMKSVSPGAMRGVMEGTSAVERLKRLFLAFPKKPLATALILMMAKTLDYDRRIRDVRATLAAEGWKLLSFLGNAELEARGYDRLKRGEYILIPEKD
jgi:hypothetical protein